MLAVMPLCLALAYAVFFLFHEDVAWRLTREDGIFEYGTAISFLLASLLAFVIFFAGRAGNEIGSFRTKRNVFFLFLALIFFLGFGEEISWGQRIFGLETPDSLARINVQNETNIHNLTIFNVLNANRLFQAFWFAYCIMLPVLNGLIPRLARVMKKMGIPVVPIFMSGLFLANYVVSRAVNLGVPASLYHGVVEVKECMAGILFFGTMFWFYCLLRNQPRRTR